VPARLFGTLLFTVPLALRGRLRLTRSALPLVATGGAAEVAGFLSYALGARHGLAVSAVLSAQFAALAALGGLLFFAERLSPRQLAGLVVIALSVAVLALTR
jgi:drug/metabolite transporter (DMT)-like permease